MIALNVAAPVRLTHHYLADMVARGHGAILNVASTAAFQPVPYMATYGATKAFVLSFSEALWAESRDRGGDADVRIVCLCPGGTDTSFDFGAGAASRGRFENTPQSTPEEVAEAGLRALEGDASYVVVGRANYAAALGTRVLPRSAVARLTAALFRPAKDGGRASTRGRARRALTRGGAIVLAGAAAAAAIRLTAARRR
jgi:short-subunit dehydrogenase